jgi:creatinine amidohydrolase
MEEATSAEFEALDRERTVVLLPVSPIEAHGSHLPLGVDYFNAVYFAEEIGRHILEKRPEYRAVIFPGIPLGTQVYRLPGSVKCSAISLHRIIYDFGKSLAASGFRFIFVLSGHGAPKNIVAVDTACVKASRRHNIQMLNLSGNLATRFLRGEFIDRISELMSTPISPEQRELLKTDFHGGWWETSMMLMLRPELVKPIYKDLPSRKRVKKSNEANLGYYGSPALADVEFATASMQVMSAEALNIVERILDGTGNYRETLSPLYKILPLRPYFRNAAVISLSAIVLAALVLLLIS